MKRALQALKLEGVSEVVGLQELRTDYKEFQERRKLRDGACISVYVYERYVYIYMCVGRLIPCVWYTYIT